MTEVDKWELQSHNQIIKKIKIKNTITPKYSKYLEGTEINKSIGTMRHVAWAAFHEALGYPTSKFR